CSSDLHDQLVAVRRGERDRQPAGPGARPRRDERRRAGRGADRPRPDAPDPQALELPRPASATALRAPPPARDREGALPMTVPSLDVLVRGGRVVTGSDVFEAAVAIKGDTIVAIGPESLLPPAARVIDAAGKSG